MSFTGTVSITASNVTLSNCLITGQNADNFEVSVSGGLSNVVIQNCTIIGAGTSSSVTGAYGIYVEDDSQVTINALNISQVGSPVTVSDGRVTITNNYIHDLNSGPSTHYNGIQYNGGGSADFSLNIQHNAIVNQQTQTDAVMIDNGFGAVKNVTVNNNQLSGGDYPQYVDGSQGNDAITGVSITNNQMGIGQFGYCDYNSGTASSYTIAVSGNVDINTLSPISSCNTP